MTNPMIRIHDVANDKIIDRQMTNEELKQYELDLLQLEKDKQEHKAAEAAKSALLAKLGITAKEAVLLMA